MPAELVWGLWIGVPILVLLVFFLTSGVVRYIANNRTAVVEKLWSGKGSIRSGFIALNGEAGFQANVLRGGIHFFFPYQYRLHIQPLVTIPQGRIGYVFARGGEPLAADQTLAANPPGADFQDVAAFLHAGGQKGPQRKILREGSYALNLTQFVVGVCDERLRCLRIGHVRRDCGDAPAQLASIFGDGLGIVGVPAVGQAQVRSLIGKPACNGLADATGRPSEERDAALQVVRHGLTRIRIGLSSWRSSFSMPTLTSSRVSMSTFW